MNITFSQILVWLIVGALAGSFTGMLVKGSKKGFGIYTNLGIGLVGALLGGLLFKLFNINLGLGAIAVSFEDLIAASVGSLIFLGMLWAVQHYRKK